MKKIFSLFFLFLISVAPAFAIDEEIVKAHAGTWIVSYEDGVQQVCYVALSADTTIGGYAVEERKPCDASSPLHDRVHAWNFADNGLIFLDAERNVLLRLIEIEDATYRTPLGATPVITMIPKN